MAATTLPSTTNKRKSLPFASLINSWTKILAFKLLKALITDSAAFLVYAKTTPFP
jgi:hypothetical protein